MIVFRQYVTLAKVKRVTKMIHRRCHRPSRLMFTFTELTPEDYYRIVVGDEDGISPDGNIKPKDIFLMEISRERKE